MRVIKKAKQYFRYDHYVLFSQSLIYDESILSDFDNFTFKEFAFTDFEKDDFFHKKNRLNRFQQYYDDGHRCFGYEDHLGGIASYNWVIGALNEPQRMYVSKTLQTNLPSACVYIFDCQTKEMFRKRGLYKQALRSIMNQYASSQFHTSYILCLQKNSPSIKGIEAAGYQELFNFVVVQVGGLHLLQKNNHWSIHGAICQSIF